MILRPYQQQMVEAIRAAWQSGRRRTLGVLPTGGGKTEVAIEILLQEATPAHRVLVLVERKNLCHQWVKRLRRHGLTHVGVLQGDNTIATSAPTLVATAQTIRSRGIPEDVKMIVIDESHIWHRTHDDVLEASREACVLGLTATPLREGLGLRFDALIVGATIRGLIADRYLVRPRYFTPKSTDVADALAEVAVRAGDFATDQLSAAMRTRAIIGDVVGTWQRRGEDRQTIAFCVDKAHARELCDEFIGAGVRAEVIVDETSDDDRERIFAAFDNAEVRVLVSVGVLSIGFDSPVASCAILARPTLSTSLYIQQGGRVLRPAPGKLDALILDHAGNTLMHGRLENFEPPTDLSMVDKDADKKKRDTPTDCWVCRHCEAINDRGDDICMECGEPRRRRTEVVVLDGELVEVEVRPGDSTPGPTLQQVRYFYLMSLWYGRSKSFANAPGWAYHATRRRFKLDEGQGKRVIAWDWRDAEPVPPDAEASRWFRADYQRSRIIDRYRAQRSSASA